jgi:hypothetical protein
MMDSYTRLLLPGNGAFRSDPDREMESRPSRTIGFILAQSREASKMENSAKGSFGRDYVNDDGKDQGN